MYLQKGIFMLLGVVLLISTFQFESVDGVRLCGKRLADLLNFICERHGGFHAPRDKRTVLNKLPSKRAVIEILRPLARRTDSGATNVEVTGSHEEGTFQFQQGIVDECCKKQCTLSTLTSYCANNQQGAEINLEEMLPAGTLDQLTISEEDLTELGYQQITSGSSVFADNGINQMVTEDDGDSNRPSLGLSNRNRPVFIVLSQAQEGENGSL